mgnify:CR=1 FL=1
MFHSKLFLPLFVSFFALVGISTAEAQMFCNGQNGCPSGYAQIEVTNDAPCDYELTFHIVVNGVYTTHTCTVGANNTLVICVDHTTTDLKYLVAEDINGNDAKLKNPGYAGNTSAAVSNGGCGGNDKVTWENDTVTGPGHVTNIIIQ